MPVDTSEVYLVFDGLKEIGDIALEAMAMDLWAEATELANVKTGDLRSSIQAQGEGSQWVVGTDLEYALYVHEGTPEHDIGSPINIDGHWVYIGRSPKGKGKPHPGYKGNPFFDDATNIVEGRTDEYIQQAIGETID